MNNELNSENKMESVYSTRVRAGKRRTYFFDVRETKGNDFFVTITESRKRFDNNGYDRHKIFIYKEDFNKFLKSLTEALDFVKTELMPDFNFDAFNHDEFENSESQNTTFAEASSETSFEQAPTQEIPVPETTFHERSISTPTSDSFIVPTTIMVDKEEAEDENYIIQEKKPLEARESSASQGDNLSEEEVDKW